jgi:hypothetical protein
LHLVGDLFELNVKLRCQKVKMLFQQYRSNETEKIFNGKKEKNL